MLWFDISVGALAAILIATGIWMTIRPDTSQAVCQTPGREHQVKLVAADAFEPEALTVQRCDTVKVLNQGVAEYELVFGTRDNHASYPGFTRQVLRPNEFFVLDAVRAGEYALHDHLRDNARLQLTIRED